MDKINHLMLNCSVNKKLKVEYQFQRKTSGKFSTVHEYNNTMYITPSFSITIGEPYDFYPRKRLLSVCYVAR